MRKIGLMGMVLVLTFTGGILEAQNVSSSAQQVQTDQFSTLDANAIVLRAYTAMGCSTVNKDTAITLTGTLHLAGSETSMPLAIRSQGNARWRSELDTPQGHKVTVVNDGEGEVRHQDGRLTKLARHNTLHQRPTHIPCLSLAPEKMDAGYLRTDMISGETLDVIELSPKERPSVKKLADRMKVTLWISRGTGYLTKLQYINASEQDIDDMQTVEVAYSDYRLVDGVAVPFRQTTTDGAMVLELKVDSVQMNASPADFTLRGR